MSLRDLRKQRRAVAPIVRAIEGGHFDDLLVDATFGIWSWNDQQRYAFAKRTSALLGRWWSWPRGAGEVAIRRALDGRAGSL